MLLTDLADVLRAAGLDVVEEPGWRTRTTRDANGNPRQMIDVRTIICHHTAGPATGDLPSLATVRDGRPGLQGPLAQLMLARSGTWHVIAAGHCNHAGVSLRTEYENSHAIGIEAEATGLALWPRVQYESYARGVRALKDHYGVPLDHVLGHKETCSPVGRKSDPNFNMAAFRQLVAAGFTPTPQEDTLSAAEVQQINDYTKALLLDGYTVDGQAKPSVLAVLTETQRRATAALAQVGALQATVTELAKGGSLTPAEVQQAAQAGANAALAKLGEKLGGA